MYADPIDEAAARSEQMIAVALANRTKPQMVFTGDCHWCEEPISSGHFCSPECREDHERMVRAEQQRKLS
ncbi:hypothetical protein [Erwinia sp. 9145]|uniref:hypothetical protein n=1 Tax=Erwinia sp. 9145 TaxID=1500895 RepID=UPI000552B038|nr:hypothetical protein [Erwinia sp. 9145]